MHSSGSCAKATGGHRDVHWDYHCAYTYTCVRIRIRIHIRIQSHTLTHTYVHIHIRAHCPELIGDQGDVIGGQCPLAPGKHYVWEQDSQWQQRKTAIRGCSGKLQLLELCAGTGSAYIALSKLLPAGTLQLAGHWDTDDELALASNGTFRLFADSPGHHCW